MRDFEEYWNQTPEPPDLRHFDGFRVYVRPARMTAAVAAGLLIGAVGVWLCWMAWRAFA